MFTFLAPASQMHVMFGLPGLFCRSQNNMLNVVLLCRASYKGFADSIRLLLFMDACLDRADKEGTIFGLSSIHTRWFMFGRQGQCVREGERYFNLCQNGLHKVVPILHHCVVALLSSSKSD